jgi:hypothetical protein
MKLSRNISTRGRWVRAASGVAFLAVAAAAWLRGFHLGGVAGRWTLIVAAATIGLFQLFEALCGWCVARALGLKTPI